MQHVSAFDENLGIISINIEVLYNNCKIFGKLELNWLLTYQGQVQNEPIA